MMCHSRPDCWIYHTGIHECVAKMGLPVPDAIRMLITHIAADKAFPFDINRVQAQPDTK